MYERLDGYGSDIESIMYERLDGYGSDIESIMYERFMTDWYFYLSNLSEHVYSSVYSYPRDFVACFACLFLRRSCPTSISSFYWSALSRLTYYRLGFFIGEPK